MNRVLIYGFSMGCAAAQFVTPVPAVMPAWVVPYPGASAANRQNLNSVESAYTVSAAPHDVLGHFRTLFTSAGLPFQPDPMGGGFLIRAAAPECDIEVGIRRRDANTEVKVTCSPRLAANDYMAKLRAQQMAENAQTDPMKKFDNPVYPQPKAATAPLTWPAWLVRVDGAKLMIERSAGLLKSSFLSMPPREGIQAYYVDLLTSNHYHVTQGASPAVDKFGSWVQGTSDAPSWPNRSVVIWIKIKPAGENFNVEVTVQ